MNRPPYLGELHQLSLRGEFDELIRRCVAITTELGKRLEVSYAEAAIIRECMGHAYCDDGDSCAAVLEFEKALELHRAQHRVPSNDVVRCLMYLGRNYLWSGRSAEAEEKLCEALMLLDHLPKKEQVGRGFVLLDLAQMHRFEGEFNAAEQLLLKAIRPMSEFGYGNEHFDYVYLHLASVYEGQGKITAADRTMEKAIRWLRCVVDRDDVGFAVALSVNGHRLQRRGRAEEARAAYTEALSILERIRKPGHYLIARVKKRLATLDEGTVSITL